MDGKIKYIRVSNFSKKQFIDAQNFLSNHDIVSDQVEYSLIVRDLEKDLLPYLQKEGVTLIAYSPLAKGAIFTNKYSKLVTELSDISKKYSMTSVQVALNWLISKEGVITIPKASTSAHAAEDAKSVDFKLGPTDIQILDKLGGKFRRRPLSRRIHPFISLLNVIR